MECDWLARPQDQWDADLPPGVGLRHAALQTLRDAIDVRSLVFGSFSGLDSAQFCIYRDAPDEKREMRLSPVMYSATTTLSRFQLHSLSMRLPECWDLDSTLKTISCSNSLREATRFQRPAFRRFYLQLETYAPTPPRPDGPGCSVGRSGAISA